MFMFITRVENRIIYSINGENHQVILKDGNLHFKNLRINIVRLTVVGQYDKELYLAEIVLAIEVTKFLKEQKIV